MQFSTGLVALAALTNSVYGHMVMQSPVPYGKSTLNNSPLEASGADFPCKQRPGVYELEGASNILEIGAPQTLSFIGGATHNGGSCQVSLTTDLQPTKESKWMVIKSIEGGCPAPAMPSGNCGTSPTDSCASTFQYTVPEGIAPGKYTIAWSWINHTGNREFYMNCGPADVVAPKKKRYNPNPVVRRQTQFPDMFVANLPTINDCTAPENFDYAYPNPGDDVEQAGAGPFTTLSCGAAGGSNAAQQPTAAAGGSAPTGAVSGASSAVASSAAAPTGGSGFGSGPSPPSASAGVFATVSAATVQPGEPSTPVTSAAAPAATGSSSGSSNSSSSSGASGACTEGDWNCIDGKSYQRCASGTWSTTMAISEGMTCQPGISSKLTWGPGKLKRVVRRDVGLFDGYVN